MIVKDNLLAYFQNVADLFKARYTELGGTVVQEEGFSSFSNTIQNAISKVAPTKADVIAFPTAFDGLAPFVGGLRALGNNTPIINSWGGDGNYWWPQNPQVQNYYYVTYGSIYGDDPKSGVNRLVKQVTAAQQGAAAGDGELHPRRRSRRCARRGDHAGGRVDEGCDARRPVREVQGFPDDLGEDHVLEVRSTASPAARTA